jgi:LysR family transcriptional regulator, glycine cleavage system transcriptional activator
MMTDEAHKNHHKIDLRQLPPLRALKGFEAAARHQSIRDAAEELNLTHPAISHQVHLIEKALGVELFTQEGRNIISSEAGQLFYPYVRSAFETLIEGIEAVRRNADDKPMRVHTYVTASIRWLAHRVPHFLAAHPEIKLELNTCAIEWAFDDIHSDVGLVYCETVPHKKFHWMPLFEYSLYPVCTPELAAKLGEEPQPKDLMALPLVTISSEDQNWKQWFESAGLSISPSTSYLVVDTLAVAIELALDGQAVALVNGPFVENEIAKGRLVQPVAHKFVCPGEWGLICQHAMLANPRIHKFFNWMAEQAQGRFAQA